MRNEKKHLAGQLGFLYGAKVLIKEIEAKVAHDSDLTEKYMRVWRLA